METGDIVLTRDATTKEKAAHIFKLIILGLQLAAMFGLGTKALGFSNFLNSNEALVVGFISTLIGTIASFTGKVKLTAPPKEVATVITTDKVLSILFCAMALGAMQGCSANAGYEIPTVSTPVYSVPLTAPRNTTKVYRKETSACPGGVCPAPMSLGPQNKSLLIR